MVQDDRLTLFAQSVDQERENTQCSHNANNAPKRMIEVHGIKRLKQDGKCSEDCAFNVAVGGKIVVGQKGKGCHDGKTQCEAQTSVESGQTK